MTPKIAGPQPTAFPGSDEARLMLVRHTPPGIEPVIHVQTYVRIGTWVGIITLTSSEDQLRAVRPYSDQFQQGLRSCRPTLNLTQPRLQPLSRAEAERRQRMPPAARITDMHVCPMVTPGVPPIPHVGGPILPPGVPTVLIGFLPAATVTGMAVCVGPPDIIAKGSTGVFINFLPAARMGDTCAHGGTIVLGEPTVMIGEIGSPSPGAGGAGAIMAGLVATGAFSPKAGEAQAALLAMGGNKGAPPAAFIPPTYTPPPGPAPGCGPPEAAADAAVAPALDPNLPEADYDGVLVGTGCQPLTTKSSPGDHLSRRSNRHGVAVGLRLQFFCQVCVRLVNLQPGSHM